MKIDMHGSDREADPRTLLSSILQKVTTTMTTNAALVESLKTLTASVVQLGVEVAALKSKPAEVVKETVVQTVVSEDVAPEVESAVAELSAAVTAVESAITAP